MQFRPVAHRCWIGTLEIWLPRIATLLAVAIGVVALLAWDSPSVASATQCENYSSVGRGRSGAAQLRRHAVSASTTWTTRSGSAA